MNLLGRCSKRCFCTCSNWPTNSHILIGMSIGSSSQEPLQNQICNIMIKDKVFQDDCFELDYVALPTNIFILPRQQYLTHSNLLVFISFGIFFRVFCCVLQQMNRAHLFIEVVVRCEIQKLSVKCGPHKKPMLNWFQLYNLNLACTLYILVYFLSMCSYGLEDF